MQIWQSTEELNRRPESPGAKAVLNYSYSSVQYNVHVPILVLFNLLPLFCFLLFFRMSYMLLSML